MSSPAKSPLCWRRGYGNLKPEIRNDCSSVAEVPPGSCARRIKS
jgi:hypothetical protein